MCVLIVLRLVCLYKGYLYRLILLMRPKKRVNLQYCFCTKTILNNNQNTSIYAFTYMYICLSISFHVIVLLFLFLQKYLWFFKIYLSSISQSLIFSVSFYFPESDEPLHIAHAVSKARSESSRC